MSDEYCACSKCFLTKQHVYMISLPVFHRRQATLSAVHGAGARVLRQDPLECAFEFICSSNNHISRIHGMVETLCRTYGTRLHATDAAAGDRFAHLHSVI